jgi:hypothetical protein
MEGMVDEPALIAAFAAADKAAGGAVQWVLEPHRDTAKAQLLVVVPDMPILAAKVHMTAHVHRVPFKYGFSLILAGSYRVLGLDVNPARLHVNFTDLGRAAVHYSHWQKWPDNLADADDRDLSHAQWFREFCKRAKITFTGSYRSPPHLGGQQLRLL